MQFIKVLKPWDVSLKTFTTRKKTFFCVGWKLSIKLMPSTYRYYNYPVHGLCGKSKAKVEKWNFVLYLSLSHTHTLSLSLFLRQGEKIHTSRQRKLCLSFFWDETFKVVLSLTHHTHRATHAHSISLTHRCSLSRTLSFSLSAFLLFPPKHQKFAQNIFWLKNMREAFRAKK